MWQLFIFPLQLASQSFRETHGRRSNGAFLPGFRGERRSCQPLGPFFLGVRSNRLDAALMSGPLNEKVRRIVILRYGYALFTKSSQQIEFKQSRIEVIRLQIGYEIVIGIGIAK